MPLRVALMATIKRERESIADAFRGEKGPRERETNGKK